MSRGEYLNNLNGIDEIIFSNPAGGKLSMKKLAEDSLGGIKRYKEVLESDASFIMGSVSQIPLQVANQRMTLSQIAKQAPNGLFTATTNPSNLSKFANGTTTTMVRDASGHLIEHAGFSNVGLRISLNPAVILSAGVQAMSAISGTYYLHKINAEFKKVHATLKDLQSRLDDSNIAKLNTARKYLSDISNREFVDTVDLSDIRTYKKTAFEIYEEYIQGLTREEGKPESKILEGKKDVEAKLNDINFKVMVAFEAYKLSLYADIVEIATRMKIGDQTDTINELVNQLKKNYSAGFYHTIEAEVEKIYSMRQQQSNKDLQNSKVNIAHSLSGIENAILFNSSGKRIKFVYNATVGVKSGFKAYKVKEKITLENKRLSTIKEYIKENKESDRINRIIDEITEIPQKEKEVIYIPSVNKKQRLFISIENE